MSQITQLRCCVRRASTCYALLLIGLPATASSQLIPVRTLPVADADQFSIFPSRTAGMAGVSIAVADSMHDPFRNPATGARILHATIFSAPTVFSVTNDAGRGNTYPLGAFGRSGAAFGGAAVALQALHDAPTRGSIEAASFFGAQPLDNPSRKNGYGFLMVGRAFAAANLSIGASAFVSDLRSVDGTNLMYFDSRAVDQNGHAADLRLGLLKEWSGGQSLEAVVLNRRLRMTHDVTYGDHYWDPTSRQIILRDRLQNEREDTRTWGVYLEYARPIGDSGWRAGAILTANRINNPNRPAFEMEHVPGGRGRSSAFNFGLGVARALGSTTLAIDAIYEPIWSRIWDGSDSLAATTADNRLRYSNALLRTGVNHDLTISNVSTLQFQLGVQARSMNYTLERHNRVSGSRTTGESSWMEWTRAWGVALRRTAFEVTYRGRIMTGASRPGMRQFDPAVDFAPQPRDVIVAPPPGPVLRDVTVSTHQFSVSLFVR